MRDQVEAVASILKQKFGEQIEVEYIDAFSPPDGETIQQVMLMVMSGRAALPITIIDGEPKIAGGISIPMIEKELESLGVEPLR